MKKIERETLRALRDFIHKIMSETILPPLYEQGFISEDYTVDIHINLKPNSAESALKKMELKETEED
jgi:hypothetical protein